MMRDKNTEFAFANAGQLVSGGGVVCVVLVVLVDTVAP